MTNKKNKIRDTSNTSNIGEYDLSGAYLNVVIDLCLDSTNIVEKIGKNKVIPINVTNRETQEVIDTHLVKQNSEAMFPLVAKKLLNEKQTLKDLKNNTDPKSPEYKNVEQKYEAFKVVILSSWGVMGNPYFRLFDPRVSSMITSIIRDLLHFVKEELKKRGHEVIYVDTDGIMINDKGKNICNLLNELIQKWSKKRFGKKSSIEFEYCGHFISLLIVAMCHYKGYLRRPDGKVVEKIKGIESKRRDSTLFMAHFQNELIERILNKESGDKLIRWIKVQIEKMKEAPLEEISFPSNLKQKPEDYKTEVTNKYGTVYSKKPPIFVQAIQNTQKLFPKFNKRVGEQFHWIYSKGKIPIAFDERLLKTHKIDVDWDFMTQRNILNKVKTIFDTCGWDLGGLTPKIDSKTVKKQGRKAKSPLKSCTDKPTTSEKKIKDKRPEQVEFEPYYSE